MPWSDMIQQRCQIKSKLCITPHIFRHTHASLMFEKGIGIHAISDRLGHANSKITHEIYLHVTKKLKEKRNEEIKNVKIFAP